MIFSAFKIQGIFAGKTTFASTCSFVPPKICISFIFSWSTCKKPFSTDIIVTTTEVSRATTIMEVWLLPIQTIIIGASAVLGREFSTTRYGSATSETKRFHQRSTAVNVPKIVPSTKPATVSQSVVPICVQSEPSCAIWIPAANMRLGWLNMKGSIQP